MTVVRPRTRLQLAGAAAAELALLGVLSVAGLGPAGWLAGIGYVVGLCTLLAVAIRRAEVTSLGPASLITLGRAVLVGGVAALVVDGLWTGAALVPILVGLAAVALALDAVDGQVARRSGTVSALGARFDMEVDAFLLLALSVQVAQLVGPWALAVGAMRYVFVAVSRIVPWMRPTVPARYPAKAVAAVQGIVLVVAASGLLPLPLAAALVSMALVLLVWSFGCDVAWLRRNSGLPPIAPLVVTVLAAVLVLAVLIAPSEVDQLTPAAFVRVPIEALVGIAVLLVLPARAWRPVAVIVGVLLAGLTIVKITDIGFLQVLGRPFEPVLDWVLLGSAYTFLSESVSPELANAAAAGVVLLTVGMLVLVPLAVLRVSGVVVRHRRAAFRALAVLTPVWLVLALVGAQIVPGVPVATNGAAALAYDTAAKVQAGIADQQELAAEAAVDAFRNVPGDQLLTALRGKDVLVAYVESYGRSAIENPQYAPQVDAVLDDGTRRLTAAGFGTRSGFLTSPTVGGISWLAHSTLLSGLWINNQARYRNLTSGDRMTLNVAFRRAGWRTVGVMPGVKAHWSEASFFGYDKVYDAPGLGYRGPGFNFDSIPDQYTLSEFERTELAPRNRAPVMAELPLLSSHLPWAPLPRPVDWGAVGDGSVFDAMAGQGESPEQVWGHPERMRTEYRRSLEYTLSTVISWVQTYGDDNLVLVLLGDHEPGPVITGEGAGRDVPITIVAKDPAVLQRISSWGWQDGLKPGPQAPVWRMDAFRDRFLCSFAYAPPDGSCR
jgi:phosphatidylglycerophosphate synthase